MIPCHRRRLLIGHCGVLLLALLGAARCAGTQSQPPELAAVAPAAASPAAAPPSNAAARSFPAAAAIPVATPDPGGKPIQFNDPPAPADSPLCGRQAREANAVAAAIQGPRLASGGICASFTCYDALTATYLGADGYRHVCR